MAPGTASPESRADARMMSRIHDAQPIGAGVRPAPSGADQGLRGLETMKPGHRFTVKRITRNMAVMRRAAGRDKGHILMISNDFNRPRAFTTGPLRTGSIVGCATTNRRRSEDWCNDPA